MTLFIEKIDSIYFKNNNLNIMELYKPVPQKEYLIEGIPARTYGEWPGIKPNHWRGSLRVIHPNQTQKIFDRRKRPFGGISRYLWRIPTYGTLLSTA